MGDSQKLRSRPDSAHATRSLAVLLLDVSRNVHEERDGQEERFHNVAGVEGAASVNHCPLEVVDVELQVAVEADGEEQERQERQFVGAERLQVADSVAGELTVLSHRLAWIGRPEALQLILMPIHWALHILT